MPIFDQGYQHWDGELSGHAWRWWAITRHGVRVGAKNRWVRMVLLAAWGPALALAATLSAWGLLEQKSTMVSALVQMMRAIQPAMVADPHAYRVDVWRLSYSVFLQVELRFAMILILILGPSLISADLRFNALPLYFARPLRRIDYFVGKLGVIVAFLGMVTIVPSVVAYIMGLAFSLDITILQQTLGILAASVLYGLIIALSGGLLILAMSTLSRNSRYVALVWVALWFVTGIVSSVLQSADHEQRYNQYLHNIGMPDSVRRGRGMNQHERAIQYRTWMRENPKAEAEYRQAELDFSQKDWRPLISYVSDLSRVGQALLGIDATWERVSQLQRDQFSRDQVLTRFRGPQFPWYWSAGVLAGLFGLSACVLNLSVKSLDRLK